MLSLSPYPNTWNTAVIQGIIWFIFAGNMYSVLMDWFKDSQAAVTQHSLGLQYLGFIFLVVCLKTNKTQTPKQNNTPSKNHQNNKATPPQTPHLI